MKKYLLIILLLASANAFAELNKWVDANGKVHYSDQPPPANVKVKTLHSASGTAAPPSAGSVTASSAPAAPKTMAEREAEFKKAQQARKEAAEQAAKEQADAEARRSNCAGAQQNLRTLESGVLIPIYDANGERSYMEDEQRQQRIAKAQQDVSTHCK